MPSWLTRTSRGRWCLAGACILPVVVCLLLAAAIGGALDASARIPVAVVNLDEGATDADGRQVAYGQDLVDSLMDAGELDWHETDERAAEAGLQDGTFELALTIPERYSEDVASVEGASPEQAVIEISSGSASNPLSTAAGSAVLRQVQSRLKSNLGRNYIISVLSNVRGQAARLSLAADGSVMLDSAFDGVQQGASAIADGIDQTASGASALSGGIGQIAQGVSALGTGTEQLSGGMRAAAAGLAPLSDGASALSAGLQYASDATVRMGSALEGIGGQLDGLSATASSAMDDLSRAGAGAAQIAGQGASGLAGALQEAVAAHERVDDLAGRLTGVSAAQEAVAGVATEAQTLSSELSHAVAPDGSDAGGLVERLAELDARYDDVADQLLGIAADGSREASGAPGDPAATGDDGQADPSAEVSELQGELERLRAERSELMARLGDAAGSAQALSTSAQTASDGLSEAVSAQGELSGALDDYDAAAQEVESSSQAIQAAAQTMAQPTSRAAASLLAMQAALAGTTLPDGTQLPGLAGTVSTLGRGVSQIGEQLGADGAIGAGAAGIAKGVEPLGGLLDGFADAASGIGDGASGLGSALDGAGQGVGALADGLHALSTAQDQLSEGTGQLKAAVGGVTDAASSVRDDLTRETSDYRDRAEVAASPVRIATSGPDAGQDGAAFMPAVLVGAVWLGSLVSAALLPGVSSRDVVAGAAARSLLRAAGGYLGLGLVQAAALLVAGGLAGMLPAREAWWALALLMACTAMAGSLCALALRCAAGRFAPLAFLGLMVLQILCAGVVLPPSLSEPALAALGSVLPMNGAVAAARALFAGSYGGIAGAAAISAAWAALALAAAALTARRRRRIRPEVLFGGPAS